MTPEKQHIAIAQVFGWTETEPWLNGERCFEREESTCGWKLSDIPNYLNDLNAMHEAEKVLTVGQRVTYASQLCLIWTGHTDRAVPIWFWIEVTARQRAEAFLRTLKLWEETP